MECQIDKYFTPEIGDIRVGYECEIRQEEQGVVHVYFDIPAEEGWHQVIIEEDDFNVVSSYIKRGGLRVPYLTKEQIEAEGWKARTPPHDYFLHKGEYEVQLKDYNQISIGTGNGVEFRGQCKDINTFRYITKLLGI